jgi:hypothetical protein
MHFEYDFDPTIEWVPEFPTISPAHYDADHSDPDSLWQSDCDATRKACEDKFYYGGFNECGKDNTFWRTFEQDKMRPDTNMVVLTGTIFCIDSWDSESFTIEMTDASGNILATETRTGNNVMEL